LAEKSDSRNAFVVALSIFVVLIIGLAVSTYYGFVERNRLRAEAADARDKAAKAVQSVEAARAKANDDIARLAEYNRMARIIQDRDNQLEQKRATLTKK
jgi:uncharacterized protein HemX